MENTLEDYDRCEGCDQSLEWVHFKSYCERCEKELNDDYFPGERDEDLFWDEGM